MNLFFLFFVIGTIAQTFDCGDTTETGNTVKCTFDASTSIFTVNGTGKMQDYKIKTGMASKGYNIVTAIINEGVTSIGKYTFYNVKTLTKVEIASTVKNINDYSFSSCSGLSEIVFASNSKLEIIGSEVFNYCTNLTSITFPSSLTSVSSNIFLYSNIETINVTGKGGIYSSIDGLLVKAENGEKQLAIYPFGRKTENYTIPNGIQAIATEAIYQNSNLKTLDCGEVKTIKNKGLSALRITSVSLTNVEVLEDSALYGLNELTTVTFGKTFKKFGENSFERCNSISTYIVVEGNPNYKTRDGILFTADGSILLKCAAQKQFTEKYVVPTGVVTIYEKAFLSQSSLTELEVGNQVENIRSKAFSGMTKLKKVTLSGNIRSISLAAFSSCGDLEQVIIGDNVKMLGTSMFLGCAKLSTVTIGENSQIITFEKFAFQGTGITSFTIPSKTKYIRPEVFSGCTSLKTVVIGEGVTHIGEKAFSGCSKLKTVTFKGSNVLRINNEAFSGSIIESIEIPSSVKYLDDGAFYSSKLKSITFKGDKQPAYCSRTAFDTSLKPTLSLNEKYTQEEFCGISTGKGSYKDIPQSCPNREL